MVIFFLYWGLLFKSRGGGVEEVKGVLVVIGLVFRVLSGRIRVLGVVVVALFFMCVFDLVFWGIY